MPKKPIGKPKRVVPIPVRPPAPSYPAGKGKKIIKGVREGIENLGQQGRNIKNTVSEGLRKVRKHVGR